MSPLTDAQIAQYRKDGFLLVKAVFSPEDVRAMLTAMTGAPYGAGELFAVPGLKHLWRDPRIVGVAKQLLGDQITFFAEATTLRKPLQAGVHKTGRHLHHDAKGSPQNIFSRVHTPPPEPFPVIRFAIYLQDFKTHSGGLKVVPGSHTIDSSNFVQSQFAYHDVPSEPGDLVCFCQKTLHSPYALRLKERPTDALSPDEEDRLSASGADVFLPPPAGRDVIFIDYAGTGPLVDLYIKSRAIHPFNAKTSIVKGLAELQFEEHARALGINLRLDFGLVEAADGIVRNIDGNVFKPEGVPYFEAIHRLSRLSRETTPQFSLFTPSADESVDGTVALTNDVISNVTRLRHTMDAVRKDPHMTPPLADG
jgi:hypothetical protein